MKIQSGSDIISLSGENWTPKIFRSARLYNGYEFDYATIYRQQPNVRTCVDFLARNVAQLGLHVFRVRGENDRERLRDHPVAELIKRPLPNEFKVTRYRLISNLMSDLGIYYNSYLLKFRGDDGRVIGLLRIPPAIVEVQGGLVPKGYRVDFSSGSVMFGPEDIIHIHGYSPDSSIVGLSPLETLRRILAEEHAMGQYREHFWRNAARMGGVIERPVDAPEWSDAARQRFKQEFEELYSGEMASGKTAVLEEGMEWKQTSFTAQESEYLSGRKLTREECARAFHIPPPLVGILDHATFSNIREQHKQLYTDTLGPWLAQIQEDFECQLLSDFEDTEGVYLEFNIQEKLRGDFHEQANSLYRAVGRPWMSANEARAIMNLPQVEGGDDLVTPLNVMADGYQSANEIDEPKEGVKTKSISVQLSVDRKRFEEEWTKLLTRTLNRQQSSIIGKVKMSPDINAVWDDVRWNEELTEDFYQLSRDTFWTWGSQMAAKIDYEFDPEKYDGFVRKNSQIFAERFNERMKTEVDYALMEDDPLEAVREVFTYAMAVKAFHWAVSRVTALSNAGTWITATDGGVKYKTWMLGPAGNHRDSHLDVAGQTVGIREVFSNGLRYPGDYQGSAEETVNCGCYLEYGS